MPSDAAGGPNAEAVRSLRAESWQRVEREQCWRAFFSWCAVLSLIGGLALAALNARDARLETEEARRSAAEIADARTGSLPTSGHAMREQPPRAVHDGSYVDPALAE